MNVYPAPVASFSLQPARWISGVDCDTRSWKIEFHAAEVHVFCPDRFFGVRFRGTPIVAPAGFWVPMFGTTGVGTGIEVRKVIFEPPLQFRLIGWCAVGE